jgi:succinate dehydrogenase/fumarate reductase flavoprotein subunit
MAAAITAAEEGARVVVLEKRPFPGGASNTPVGFGFVKKDRASRDKAFESHMEGTLWTANADLVRAFVNTSGEIPEWLTGMGRLSHTLVPGPPIIMGEPAPGSGWFRAAVDTQGYCALKPVGRAMGERS